MNRENEKAMFAGKKKSGLTKKQIIGFMDNEARSPRMESMVKFINQNSNAKAKLNTRSRFHVGRTHSSGVRIGSGHSTLHHNVTVTDSNGNVMINDEIAPRDFAVWVYENIMNRKHWRYSGDTMTKGKVGSSFDEWDKQEIENEKNDKT